MADLWSDAENARRWEASHLEGNPTRAGHLELLVELLAAAGPGCCLDLGCGSGLVAERILDRHEDLQVFGIDSSPPMLEMARARLDRFGKRVRLAQADLSNHEQFSALDVPSELTAAIAVQALHHLDRPDLKRLLALVRERLRTRGLLLVVDPVLASSRWLYPLFWRAKTFLGWRWNPEAFEEYGGGLGGQPGERKRSGSHARID